MDYTGLINLACRSRALTDWREEDPEGYERFLSTKAEAEKTDIRFREFLDSLTPEQKAAWEELKKI